MERGAREFMKSLISIHDTECQIISFHGSNADGKGIVTQNSIKKVVPYGAFTTSVFNKGQQSFVLSDSFLRVVPIISYSPSFDDSNAKHNVHIFIFFID